VDGNPDGSWSDSSSSDEEEFEFEDEIGFDIRKKS